MKIQRLFIANRGEIAVRIIRAARKLGIHTIQAISEADTDSLAARLADETALIGPAPATKSYLDINAVMTAIAQTEADAVHPGYGFLSENARFVECLEAAGVTFVGPSAAAISKMGDKVKARAEAEKAGVPIVPGSRSTIRDIAAIREIAGKVGYPVMIKASAGGGGRGIRVVHNVRELEKLVPQAQAEARAAFGDDSLYLERHIERARHVEVQLLADGERALHLGERECSLQRNRQKVWEESPAPTLPVQTRKALCESAVVLAESVAYRGAGTVEYLYDEVCDEFYFIEMNTRIQVEHPVTEAITGVDLVAAQLRIAGGEPLWLTQDDIQFSGHAIEVRINAENPANRFMPSPGQVIAYRAPAENLARFDTLLFEGCRVSPYYDSLVGKLIVQQDTRQAALSALTGALSELSIEGIKTTIPLHQALARVEAVRSAEIHTGWLESWLATEPMLVT